MYGFCSIYGVGGLILAIWIYGDAEIHGQDGLLWAVLVFFFSIPALLIYFLLFRQGIGPPRKHKAISRNEDFKYRAKYSAMHTKYGSPTGRDVGTIAGGAIADPDFTDPEIDILIDEGKFSEARDYVDDMIQMAHEMNDDKGVINYTKYKTRIGLAQTQTK